MTPLLHTKVYLLLLLYDTEAKATQGRKGFISAHRSSHTVHYSGGASRQQELDHLVTLYPHQKEESDEHIGSAYFRLLFSPVF